jgi:hypothetical protein
MHTYARVATARVVAVASHESIFRRRTPLLPIDAGARPRAIRHVKRDMEAEIPRIPAGARPGILAQNESLSAITHPTKR